MPNTLHVDYELMTYEESMRIVEEAMKIARQEIPKGAVADYIPELDKADPNQLGICIYPIQGEKIELGDYKTRFTIQSVSKIISLCVALELFGPALDPKGNSIAGCRLLKEIASKLRLSLFYDTEFMTAATLDYSLTQKKEHYEK